MAGHLPRGSVLVFDDDGFFMAGFDGENTRLSCAFTGLGQTIKVQKYARELDCEIDRDMPARVDRVLIE